MGKALRQVPAEKGTPADYGLVSVIMPSYRSERFIRSAIDSVMAQTYQNWELIIVDDCSPDGSVEIISKYGDPRIHLIRNQHNCGAAVSRNNAIENARGRWIAFLDSDDLWDPNKLLHHLGYMVQTGSAFSFTHYAMRNAQDGSVTVFSPGDRVYDYHTILKHCYVGCSTVIYDSLKLGKFYMPVEAAKREDFACWLQILKTGINATCLQECLTTYTVHENSVSSNKLKIVPYQWNVYRRIEGLSVLRSLYYMAWWTVLGLRKYR